MHDDRDIGRRRSQTIQRLSRATPLAQVLTMQHVARLMKRPRFPSLLPGACYRDEIYLVLHTTRGTMAANIKHLGNSPIPLWHSLVCNYNNTQFCRVP
jgi:hypothetical protein